MLELYTWSEAEINCRDVYAANLVAITDRFEQSSLNQFITDSGNKWIGLSDLNSPGTYTWSSGDSFSFSHWDRNQPGEAFFENKNLRN